MNTSISDAARTRAALDELARLIARFSNSDGIHITGFPALSIIRGSEKTAPLHTVYEPSICLVAQGRKWVMLGEETYGYGPSDYFAVSVGLPISGQVAEASPEQPYLAAQLHIDPQQVADLMPAKPAERGSYTSAGRGLCVSRAGTDMLDAFVRLLRLLETPHDLNVLAPMAAREILYRALHDEQNHALRQMLPGAGRAAAIAEVIRRIRQAYAEPLRIGELAGFAGMSPSSLHRYFREVTAMSPLQFQKRIRLQEARKMLLSEPVQAAEAAFRVGYESPSQFNREYVRLFGLPPLSDVRRLRSLPAQAALESRST